MAKSEIDIKKGDVRYMIISENIFIGVVENVEDGNSVDGASEVYALYNLTKNKESYFPFIINNIDLRKKINSIKVKYVKNRIEYYKPIVVDMFPEMFV